MMKENWISGCASTAADQAAPPDRMRASRRIRAPQRGLNPLRLSSRSMYICSGLMKCVFAFNALNIKRKAEQPGRRAAAPGLQSRLIWPARKEGKALKEYRSHLRDPQPDLSARCSCQRRSFSRRPPGLTFRPAL